MCCTLNPAELTNTILYAGEGSYKGRYVHVVAYANHVESFGPNAMILPFPAVEPMGPDNMINTERFSKFMLDISLPMRPQSVSRGMTKSAAASVDAIVFEQGSYHVVLAKDTKSIPEALKLVPPEKRPNITESYLKTYAILYPDWPIAVCCWNGNGEMAPEPLLWWYIPSNPGVLFAPAMDAHDGNPPRLNTEVKVDHYLAFSSSVGARVNYRQYIPDEVRTLLPERIKGRHYQRTMPNGDFRLPVVDSHSTTTSEVQRGTRNSTAVAKYVLMF